MVCDEMFTKEYLQKVNRAYSIMCSRKQSLPKIVESVAKKTDTILDFGAGKDAFGTKYLREKGFDVTAYEIGKNAVEGLHDPKATHRRYDVVFASSVLNIQPEISDICNVVMDVQACMNKSGKFICNLPRPIKSKVDVEYLASILRLGFQGGITKVKNGSPTWVCVYDW
jgi:16S rRNA A1518/A1519 N6-dimethyltransferase RsmA/KsgA/DIM1 with predicted DNA glycosylase/AP lyase activity